MSVETASPTPIGGYRTGQPAATDLRVVAVSLWRRIFVVMICAIAAVLLAAGYLAIAMPRYVASAEILLDPRGLQVMQNDLNPRAAGSDLGMAVVESQLRVVQSEAILRVVVDRLDLARDPEFLGETGLLAAVKRLLLPSRSSEEPRTAALRALQKRLSATRADRSFVIIIHVSTEDALKSAKIADAAAAAYLDREAATHSDTAQRAAASLTARLKELAERLKQSESRVESYKAEHNLIGTPLQLVSDQQLSELNNRLIAARARSAEERARYEQIERLLKSGAEPDRITEAVQSVSIAGLRAQYAEVIRREASIATIFGPQHPETAAIREQRERLTSLINTELRRIADAARNDYGRAQASERVLSAELETLKRTVVQSGEALVRLRELEREAQSNRTIYEAFLVRAKEIGEQRGVDSNNARVIAEALPPNRPAGPPAILIVIAAAAAGLSVGIGIALLQSGLLRPPA